MNELSKLKKNRAAIKKFKPSIFAIILCFNSFVLLGGSFSEKNGISAILYVNSLLMLLLYFQSKSQKVNLELLEKIEELEKILNEK